MKFLLKIQLTFLMITEIFSQLFHRIFSTNFMIHLQLLKKVIHVHSSQFI